MVGVQTILHRIPVLAPRTAFHPADVAVFPPRGAHFPGSVGPQSDTVGHPTAAARCIGPLSFPSHNDARFMTAASSDIENRPNQFLPGNGSFSTNDASFALPIHPTSALRFSSSHAATSRKRSPGQFFRSSRFPGKSGREAGPPLCSPVAGNPPRNAATLRPGGQNNTVPACGTSTPSNRNNYIKASAS